MSTLLTSIQMKDVLGKMLPNELLSKNYDDKVEPIEIKKPEAITPGLQKTQSEERCDLRSSPPDPMQSQTNTSQIVSPLPNLNKQRGEIMSNEGFIKLPRALLESEDWRSLRWKQQKLFLYVLQRVKYKPCIWKYNGHDIPLKPGQLCISLRSLVEDYNQTVKFRDEKVDLPFVQRAVSAFTRFSVAIHHSIHGICVISISNRALCEHFEAMENYESDTGSIQARYNNEERKKEENIKETIEKTREPDPIPISIDPSLLNLEKNKKQQVPVQTLPIQQAPVQQYQSSIFDAQPTHSTRDLSEEQVKHLNELWKFAIQWQLNDGNTPKSEVPFVVPGITENDLIQWLKVYSGQDIYNNMKIIKNSKTRGKIESYPRYIAGCLKKQVGKKEEAKPIGIEFVKDFIKKNGAKHLDMKASYVTDLINNDQMPYSSAIHTLEAWLKRSMERFQEHEEQERRAEEYAEV